MNYTTIVSPTTLKENIDNPDWVILDCRIVLISPEAGKNAYIDNHIANAHYVHLEDDFSSPITPESGRHPLPDMQNLKKRLGELGIDSSKQVVVYDDTFGAYATRIWWQIRAMGHQNVAVLDGGLIGWLMHELKLTKEIPAPKASTFDGEFDASGVVTTEQIQANLNAPSFTVLDARSPERFRGEEEPLDTVAGHVPNAINRAFQANLDEKGYFLSVEELKEAYQPLIDDAENNQIVNMCGSGVTACHNLLAMEIAGFTDSKLYIGSWSEWIRDSERPVVTES